MAISKSNLTKKTNIVKSIFEKQGINYDDWLAEQLDSVINENLTLITEGLSALTQNTANHHQNRGGI